MILDTLVLEMVVDVMVSSGVSLTLLALCWALAEISDHYFRMVGKDTTASRPAGSVHRSRTDGPVAIAYTPRSFFEAGSEAYQKSIGEVPAGRGKDGEKT